MAGDEPAPAWLPDWRNAADYPADLSDHEWHWQFLRRHAGYRRLWTDPIDESAVWSIVVDGRRGRATQGRQQVETWLTASSEARELRAVYVGGAADYGVRCLLDPALPRIPPEIEREFWTTAIEYEGGEFSWMFAQDMPPTTEQWDRWRAVRHGGPLLPGAAQRPFVVSVVDLRLDVDRQLDAERGWLNVLKRDVRPPAPATKHQKGLWPAYLRVLDARESKASWDAIGKCDGLLTQKQRHAAAKYAEQVHGQAMGVMKRLFPAS